MTVRVVVVDDTEHVRRMLVEMLALYGFDVVGEAGNASDAVARVDELDPDVVVMDFKMPGVDGLEATREIRERRPHQSVILYSAYLDDELRERAREAGAAASVPKAAGVEALATEISAIAMDLGR